MAPRVPEFWPAMNAEDQRAAASDSHVEVDWPIPYCHKIHDTLVVWSPWLTRSHQTTLTRNRMQSKLNTYRSSSAPTSRNSTLHPSRNSTLHRLLVCLPLQRFNRSDHQRQASPSCNSSLPIVAADLSIPVEGCQMIERTLEADYVIVGALSLIHI